MDWKYIKTARDGKLLTITINRPEVMNAISPAASHEMAAAIDVFEADDRLWVAIITGAGDDAFCAGGDISVMNQAKTKEDYQMPPSGYGGMTSREGCYKPIIAAVNGIAFGGGFEVALACDVIVASDTAMFGLPEPKIGVAAVAGGIHRLVRQIGLKPAMGLLLTGGSFTAQRAYELGLINELVPQEQVLTAAKKWAERIMHCAPLAVRATKQTALEGLKYPDPLTAIKAQEAGEFNLIDKMMKSEDTQEGLNAFIEKRRPLWKAQ